MFRVVIILLILFCQVYSDQKSNQRFRELGFEYKIKSNKIGLVNYKKPDHKIENLSIDQKLYKKINIPNSASISNPGEPDLPSSSTFIAVDPNKKYSVSVNVLSSRIIDNITIAPKGSWENDPSIESFEGEEYSNNGFYPQKIATLSETKYLRELAVVSLNVTPFRYFPSENRLEEYTDIEIEIIEMDNVLDNDSYIPQKRSRAFEPLYQSMVANYESLQREHIPYQKPSILYVLPSNIGNLINVVNALMDWKKRVGYEVNYVFSSNIVNSSTNLKNYIETAYESWDDPPEYVTIIADAEGSYDVPTFFENYSGYNGEGDHPYSTLVGSDFLPEVFLGRLSFDSQSHLETIISKTLNYESNPYMGENWFKRAALIGDPSDSGISCIITNESIKEMLEMNGYSDIRTVYSGNFASQMQNNLNDGLGFFNYRGFYGVSGFGESNLINTTNGFMLPIATVITCGVGSFGTEESLIEKFIRAGTSQVPKGSVACIGTATLGTHTMFNNVVDMGFYYGALIDDIPSVGGALMAGKLYLAKAYPSNPNQWVSIFTHWNNLMGDASLQMWTSLPEMLNVTHNYSLPKGTNYIDIVVKNSEQNPVEDAWVTIYKANELVESKYSDSNGFVRLDVTTVQNGDILVTVTKNNHYPYKSSFQIYDPGPSVNLHSEGIIIDDSGNGGSIGNADGFVNPGETIALVVAVTNYGNESVQGISGSISTDNSGVQVISDAFNYGELNSGDIVNNNSAPFTVKINSDVEHGSEVHLILSLVNESGYSSTGLIELIVEGKNLFAYGVDIPGTNVDVLSPGQSSIVDIELYNSGSVSANNITGTITSGSNAIEIIDNNGSWFSVYPGMYSSSSTGDNSFMINATEETIPGTIANIILNVESEDGYSSSSIIPIQIGTPVVTDPLGPDSHGYYMYDSGDIDYLLSPTYEWIEIDSRYGGQGTYLSSLDDNGDNDDDVQTINIPFDFKFYGVQYRDISISSNGWISFGETEMSSFRNYPMPGPGGPGQMVAVFWDDLKLTNSGRVYTWYDSNEKIFIIQWSRVRTYQNNSTETFQVILRDPTYYMTPTGDGEILIQFMEFNNTTNGSYSWSQIHGDYCTVGIEDHTMTKGLTYTFNNTYPDPAMPLGDETAILITTRGSEMRLDGDLNMDAIVDINDLLILIDHIVANQTQFNPFLADVNNDGMVNILDMVKLIQMVMGYE